MKRILTLILISFVISTNNVFAQKNAAEVLKRTASVLDSNKGYQFDIETQVPLQKDTKLHVAIKGDNAYVEEKDTKSPTALWVNGQTMYSYDANNNTVTIHNWQGSLSKFTMWEDMTENLEENDDLKLKKTSDGFVITASDKGANVEFVADAQTYYPKSIKMKVMLLTVSIKFSNVKTGICDEIVTYTPSRYPKAKVVDKR